MKKIPVSRFKKLLSVFLAAIMLFSMIPSFVFNASAANSNFTKVADPATVNDWKNFFGPDIKDTTWVGGVWTDKSVFGTVKDYTDATDEAEGANFPLSIDDDNFLVSLSAIASTKSIEGYSTLPTDTILVLDLSGSMNVTSGTDPYVTMVNAANNAIDKLLSLNANNRVGVIAYNGNTNSNNNADADDTAKVILPLGRWNKGIDSQNRNVYLVSSWRERSGYNTVTSNGVKVASGVTGTKAAGVSNLNTNSSMYVEGGTYTQNGIYKAQQMFDSVEDVTITEGVQAGTKRKPVMVLMSDGCPTVATTNYTRIGDSDSGNGVESSYGSNGIAFITQLTAAWARDKIEEKYDNDALVYTLGLNVGDKEPALSLLDPSNNNSTNSYWNTFKGLADSNNKTMSVNIRTSGTENKTITYSEPVNETKGWSEDYVTQYFGASNTDELNAAFEDIVEQIVVQSLYYPTLVDGNVGINHDGFIEFEDYIGKNMEVKAVKGIQLGSTLYDGSTLAKMIYTGGMGSEQNPTEAGDNMVWAVKQRMGIEDTSVARALIGNAYATGQLYYDAVTGEYSNYIGWYADEEGKFVAFWDGKDDSPEAVPAEIKDRAVFANKSYGYYDAVGEGYRKTDMMYATILVRTTVKENDTDASEVGDIRLIGRIPAALIPLVEYDIQLNGTDPQNPSSMTITGASAPSRLLYEVGLHSDIDLLDIEGTAPDELQKDENGNYIFYTNQWHSIDNYSYSTNKNTTTWFEPSVENERYYYNVDSEIFTDTNGTLYKGASAPVYSSSSPLYHRNLVYKASGNRVTAEWYYEEISEYALNEESDLGKRNDNTWYVKAGTIHHYFADYEVAKDENPTGTIDYSDKPFVHEPEEGVTKNTYHIDSYLGNNGLLTVDPYEGIKVSKTADATITDREQSYEFIVTADVNANLTLIKEDIKGVRTETAVAFNNSLNVSIKHGETFWLLGEALTGKAVKIAENTEGKDYEVYSVNGDTALDDITITVEDATISSAAFVNTVPQDGDVVISKTVVSDIAGHFDDEFSFLVTITGADAEAEYPIVFSSGSGSSIASGDTIELSHNESATIKDIPENAVVTVEEIDIPKGFSVDEAEKSVTVAAGETAYLAFTNTYSAEDTDPANISITINKNLTDNTGAAADWSGDFEFQLQRWNGTGYVNYGDPVTVSYTKGGANTAAIELLKKEVYTEVGNYYYRVVEIVDQANVDKGVIYDTVYGRFYVTVADNGEGKLYIESINSLSDTSISGNNVTVTFNNSYNVSGAAEAVIDINKVVKNVYNQTANILPAGFSFSLYEANSEYTVVNNTAVATSPVTAAAGTARISMLYDELGDVGTHYYVLKEDKGNIDNVTYTDKEYHVEVTVDDINGYYSIAVKVYDEDGSLVDSATATASAGSVIAVAEVDGADFENIYTPDSVTLTPNLSATKNLLGRDIIDGEFTFALYETGADFAVGANQSAFRTATANASGAVNFGELSYAEESVHYYVVKEVVPEGAVDNKLDGVTYDTKEYHITVTVTGNSVTGQLSATSVMTLDGAEATVMVFNNSYVTEPTSAEIIGSKHLAGGIRKLQAGAFSFELLENGEVIDTVANGIPTDDYNAEFKFNLSYNAVGEHTYIVREKHPQGVDASGKLNGVVYDLTEYEVKVSVVDDGDGNLIATVIYEDGDVEFNNSYNVSPVSAEIKGNKNLKGDAISKYAGEKAFEFALYNANDLNTPIATVTNDATGEFVFKDIPELTFANIGGYRFVVKEIVPETIDPLMVYDAAYFEVEIAVTDNLLGALTYAVKYTRVADEATEESGIAFNNEYKVAPISVNIPGEKSYNKELTDGMFTFELYQALEIGGKITAVGDAVLETTNTGKEFSFADITTEDGKTEYLTYSNVGTYYYVVKEKLPEGVDENGKLNGITYDKKEHVVTVTVTEVDDGTGRAVLKASIVPADTDGIIVVNSYSVAPTSAVIGGKKNLKGDAISKYVGDKAFKFELYAAGDMSTPIAIVGNDANGEFTFSRIPQLTFNAEGDYKFVVKEFIPADKDPLMVYDTNSFNVTIKVTDDGKGNLDCETVIDGATEIAFDNEYKAEAVTAVIGGEKSYNKELADGMFTFQLYKGEKDAQGNIKAVGNALLEAQNLGNKFTFAEGENTNYITYTEEGTHYYVIKEKLPEGVSADGILDGIKYDVNEHLVTVTVTESINTTGRAILTAEVKAADENGVVIVNSYSTEKTSFTINGNKVLNGRDLKEGEFTFVLYDGKGGKISETVNGKNGEFSFAPIVIEEAGEYTYTVKEDASENQKGITYDARTYTVVLTVTDNGKGGLDVEDKYSVENNAAEEIEFVNTYKELQPPAPTGDGSNIILWSVIAGIVLLGIITLLVLSRKKFEDEK